MADNDRADDMLNESNFEEDGLLSSTIISVDSLLNEDLDNTLINHENDSSSCNVSQINNENESVVIVELTLTEDNNAVSNAEEIDEEGINLLVKAVEESMDHFDCDSDDYEAEITSIKSAESENNCKEVVLISNETERVESKDTNLALLENRERPIENIEAQNNIIVVVPIAIHSEKKVEDVNFAVVQNRKRPIKNVEAQNNCIEVVPIAIQSEKVEDVNFAVVENRKRPLEENDQRKSDDDNSNLKKQCSQQSNDSSIEQLNSLLNETVRSEMNYSRDIFDNDADKSMMKQNAGDVECGYNADYFNYVNRLWCVDTVPDPHRNVTKRFSKNNVSDVQLLFNQKSQISLPVNSYLQQRIGRVEEKLNGLDKNLKALIKNGSTQTQQNKVISEIEELTQVVVDMKRDQAEVKHKFEFYKEPYAKNNANYLTSNCVQQLCEQEQLINFQKNFYQH